MIANFFFYFKLVLFGNRSESSWIHRLIRKFCNHLCQYSIVKPKLCWIDWIKKLEIQISIFYRIWMPARWIWCAVNWTFPFTHLCEKNIQTKHNKQKCNEMWKIKFYSHNNGLWYRLAWWKLRIFAQHWSVNISTIFFLIASFFCDRTTIQPKIHRFHFSLPFRVVYRFFDIAAKRIMKFWTHLDFVYRWTDLYKKEKKHLENLFNLTNEVRWSAISAEELRS